MNQSSETAAARTDSEKRRVAVWFVAVVVLALAVRLVYLVQLQDSPLFEHPVMDARVHHEWAQKFAAGEPWSVDERTGEPLPYFRAPLYVWFLGVVYKIFGPDPGFAPRLVQSLLGALSCGFVFLIGTRVFGRKVGLAAGAAAALDWILVYFDNELLIVPLVIFLDLVLILLLLAAFEKRKPALWIAAGLALGLSALARPNILLFAPFLCAWIVLIERRGGGTWRRGVLTAIVFGLGILLPILPVTIRNAVVGKDRVLIASQGGVNFYIGNNPRTDGVTAVVPGTPPDWWGGYYATRAMAARALGREPKPSEVSQYFFGEALRFWKEEPGKALFATAAKTRYFLSRQEFANNKCIYTFTEEFTPVTKWLVVGFWIFAPLGLLGLFITLGSALRLFPLWGFAAAYSASVIVFFITARYRAPVVPVLIIYAAYALFWLVDKARLRSLRALLPAAAALLLLFALVLHVPGSGFGRVYRNTEEALWTLGTELEQRGEHEQALGYMNRCVDACRATLASKTTSKQGEVTRRILSGALFGKGKILEALNRQGEALAAYEDSLRLLPLLVPERAMLLERMAAICEALGRRREAERLGKEAERIRSALSRQGFPPSR